MNKIIEEVVGLCNKVDNLEKENKELKDYVFGLRTATQFDKDDPYNETAHRFKAEGLSIEDSNKLRYALATIIVHSARYSMPDVFTLNEKLRIVMSYGKYYQEFVRYIAGSPYGLEPLTKLMKTSSMSAEDIARYLEPAVNEYYLEKVKGLDLSDEEIAASDESVARILGKEAE